VTGNLLDTNVVLRALTQPSRLSARVRNAVVRGPNVISAVVFWEVVLKVMKGNLIVGEPRSWWFDALDMLAATSLDLQPAHVAKVFSLPPIHSDPFDRILIAQAAVEHLTLITTDQTIQRYAGRNLKVLA